MSFYLLYVTRLMCMGHGSMLGNMTQSDQLTHPHMCAYVSIFHMHTETHNHKDSRAYQHVRKYVSLCACGTNNMFSVKCTLSDAESTYASGEVAIVRNDLWSPFIHYMGWLRLVGSLKLNISFAEYKSRLQGSFATKTYNFNEPTTCSHPITVESLSFSWKCHSVE